MNSKRWTGVTLQDLLAGVGSFSETIDPCSLASSSFFSLNIVENKIKLVP